MATVNKDFKIKQGLIVEGTTATVNSYDVLTKKQDDIDYIVNLIGGTATSANTPDTVVKRDGNGSFAAEQIDAAKINIPNTGALTNTNSQLELYANNNNELTLKADANVNINSSDAVQVDAINDVILSPNGYVVTEGNKFNSTSGNNYFAGNVNVGMDDWNENYNAVQFNVLNNNGDSEFRVDTDNDVIDFNRRGGANAVSIKAANNPYTQVSLNNGTWMQFNNQGDNADTQAELYSDGDFFFDARNGLQVRATNGNLTLDANDGDVNVSAFSWINLNNDVRVYGDVNVQDTLKVGGWNGNDGIVQVNDSNNNNKIYVDANNNEFTLNNYANLYFNNGNGVQASLKIDDNLIIDGQQGINVDAYNNSLQLTAHDADVNVHANGDVVLSTNNGNVVLLPDNAAFYGGTDASQEIATQGYVDNAVAGLDWKQAVNLLSTTHIDLESGGSPVNFNNQIIDGHTLSTLGSAGYRILLTGQSQSAQNGIYELIIQFGELHAVRSADADTYQELVGAAVYVMEGDQYGSTSWVQSNHYLTDFTNQDWTQFSGQGSVTAGTGIVVDGLQVSVDRNTVDTWYDAAGAASGAVSDHASDTVTHGVTGNIVGTSDVQTLTNKTIDEAILTNTVSFRDGSNNESMSISHSYTGTSRITANDDLALRSTGGDIILYPGNDTPGVAGKAYIHWGDDNWNAYPEREIATHGWVEGLTTDSFDEGSNNLYYTDDRAKSAAISLLTNANKTFLTNIEITANNAGGLNITAENGVADSTTDDLEEGVNNLYFTDSRAVSALENVTPNFTEIDVNSVAKQIAATTGNITTASTVTGYAFDKNAYRSAKFLVKCAYGSHTEVSEVILTLDSSDNIAITEYATVGTNGSSMTISANTDAMNVNLQVTTVNNNSTVSVVGTLLA